MLKYVLLVVVASMMLVSCGGVMSPLAGFIYTDLKAPFTVTSSTSMAKMGEAECTGILGLVATGDCSIEAAKKAGGITEVTSVDYKSWTILGIISKFTVIVTGK